MSSFFYREQLLPPHCFYYELVASLIFKQQKQRRGLYKRYDVDELVGFAQNAGFTGISIVYYEFGKLAHKVRIPKEYISLFAQPRYTIPYYNK